MKEILPGVLVWSIYNEEKQIFFNGHVLAAHGGVVVDPPSADAGVIERVIENGGADWVFITNASHARACQEMARALGAKLAIHEADALAVDFDCDRTCTDGEELVPNLKLVHVPGAKTPGESALYWRERRIMIVGDAVIGRPAGALSMLPPEKFRDFKAACNGVHRLSELNVEVLLVGDGTSILTKANYALEALVAEHEAT